MLHRVRDTIHSKLPHRFLGEKRVDERLVMVVDPALPEQFVANRVDRTHPLATALRIK